VHGDEDRSDRFHARIAVQGACARGPTCTDKERPGSCHNLQMRRALFSVVTASVFAACGGASSQNLAPSDNNTSSSGGTTDGGSSGGPSDGSSGGDARNDGRGKTDGAGGPDAPVPPTGVVTTQITITDLFQDCMPIVASDPITMK